MSEPLQHKLRHHQFWLFVGWSLVCFVIYSSLATSGLPTMPSMLNDKISHMLGYFVLMVWFLQLYWKNNTKNQ